ncbi:TPA: hypothetical protein ACX4IJ_001786 [Klebsiella pneumoniae]
MTTNITALAQSLKAAAEKAKHAGEAPIMSFDARISALNEYQITACPDNVLALVEALEKALQQITQLESRTVTVKLPDYGNTYKSPFADEVEHQVRLALELFSSAAGIKVEVE